MERVIIIGCGGAGKSTLARALHKKLGLPVVPLDQLWWREGWQNVSREEFDRQLDLALEMDRWIIDGNYGRTLESRLSACDTVFLFDLPVEVCLEGALSRIGKARYEMPWIETEFDPEFKKQIEDFPSKELPRIYALLEKYNDKNVYVFKSRQIADAFLEGLPTEGSTL